MKAYQNNFCIGRMRGEDVLPEEPVPVNGEVDGKGFICSKALGEPKCTTAEELASFYCACCHCYVQCGLGRTIYAVCKHNGTCDE
jgi:hypothetical protein